ncbi:MAG: zinc-ribbon domain-containing protein [Pseudomonadota bacterium]
MRLVCPNCGAQYDVPAEVIPAEGRDVQCSNCGDTWFQESEATLQALAEDSPHSTAEPTFSVPAEPPAPKTNEKDVPSHAETQSAFDEDVDGDVDGEVDFSRYDPNVPADDNFSQAVNSAKIQKTTLTRDVEQVLREEAAFETKARQTPSLETQSELGDLSSDETDEDLRDKIKSLESLEDRDIAVAGGRSARRNLLPDVEEINSSLRTTQAKKIEDLTPEGFEYISEEYEIEHRRGFRWGFVGTLSGIAAAIALYIFADPLKERAPDFAGPIDTYVATIDRGRAYMDDALLEVGIYVQTLMAQATQAVTDRQAQ